MSRAITVVGDLLMDVDLDGAVERLSPDAPVPVVDVAEVVRRPGGAGLVARLLARDGHRVTLVTAHGAAGDVLVLLSTSGTSGNLLRAADAARRIGMTVWALTGPTPNPLADLADDVLTLPGRGANVQEAQLVAIHALCRVFDARVRDRIGASR